MKKLILKYELDIYRKNNTGLHFTIKHVFDLQKRCVNDKIGVETFRNPFFATRLFATPPIFNVFSNHGNYLLGLGVRLGIFLIFQREKNVFFFEKRKIVEKKLLVTRILLFTANTAIPVRVVSRKICCLPFFLPEPSLVTAGHID